MFVGNDTPASAFRAGLCLSCWHQHRGTGDRDLLGVLPNTALKAQHWGSQQGPLEKNIWQQREEWGEDRVAQLGTGFLPGSHFQPRNGSFMRLLPLLCSQCPPGRPEPPLSSTWNNIVTGCGFYTDWFALFFFSYKLIGIQTCIKNPQGVLNTRYVQSVSTAFPVQKLSTIAKRHGVTGR